CPKCRTTLKAPERKAGARSKCPRCGCPVQVPRSSPAGLRAGKGRPVSNPSPVPEVLPAEDLPEVLPVREPAGSAASRRRRAKRGGSPLGPRGVIIPAGALLLCGVVGIIGVVGGSGGSGSFPSDATTNVDRLAAWCERSSNEIKAAAQANPIRAGELAEKHR